MPAKAVSDRKQMCRESEEAVSTVSCSVPAAHHFVCRSEHLPIQPLKLVDVCLFSETGFSVEQS